MYTIINSKEKEINEAEIKRLAKDMCKNGQIIHIDTEKTSFVVDCEKKEITVS